MRSFAAFVTVALASNAAARTFTVFNQCPFTIWPALFSSPGSVRPSQTTGWQQNAFQTVSFAVPDNWNGRIWARRDCDFSTGTPGPNSCIDGGCNGGLVCDPNTGTGVPPATLAEFQLGPVKGPDNYDVSMVDGYNLPLRINNNKGCRIADCPVDLGPNCPAPLKGPFDSTGFPVGCKSACLANLDGDPANSPNCCTGSHNQPSTCPSSGVQFYSYFKSNCPNAYAYAYDDLTSLFTCDASLEADYTLTFCP
ncbi:Osmotin thaumatin-like protein [Lenzites betulinus]|nr:Osmotin thaumatin-like protein [Lenzites betulinus]